MTSEFIEIREPIAEGKDDYERFCKAADKIMVLTAGLATPDDMTKVGDEIVWRKNMPVGDVLNRMLSEHIAGFIFNDAPNCPCCKRPNTPQHEPLKFADQLNADEQ